MRFLLFSFLIWLFILPAAVAQDKIPEKAARAYDAALAYHSKSNFEAAERSMQEAIKLAPSYLDAYSLLGQWLFELHRYSEAVTLLQRAEKQFPNGPKLFALPITKSLIYSGDYTTASKRIPPGTNDPTWKSLEKQALAIRQAASHADTNKVILVGPPGAINTAYAAFFPFIAADARTLYFTRRVNGMDEDFFYTTRDSCDGWYSGTNMGSPPNTLNQEAAQSISADGHYLFFMRCDNRSDNGWDQGGCDLYMSYTSDSVWSVPQSFGATINTPAFEGMPSLSSDNRELFFVSDREGGYGGKDLWSSRFEHGLWQLPRNLGPSINTAGDETAPFIYADNETLYFASTGHTGLGGSDLFITHRINDSTWSEPVNLGMPFNTPDNEISMSIDAKGDTAYFSSDRNSPSGIYKIYQIRLPQLFKPAPITFLKGCIYDSITGNRLNYANIYITDSASGKELYQVQSNRGDGSYTIALPLNKTYFLLTDRISFQNTFDTLRCYEPHIDSPAIKNISMLPFNYERPVVDSLIMTVYFKKNSREVTDSDKIAVTNTMHSWLGAKDITIFVNGYTDNNGTPLLNEQLSYVRSKIVAEIVGGTGFPGSIIQSQGWGEASPKEENDTDEHRDKNRRVEIVIRLTR